MDPGLVKVPDLHYAILSGLEALLLGGISILQSIARKLRLAST